MEIFIDLPEILKESVIQLMEMLTDCEFCERPGKAILIIVGNKQDLHRYFNPDKYFILLSQNFIKNLPSNVYQSNSLEFASRVLVFIEDIHEKSSLRGEIIFDIATSERIPAHEATPETKNILVVDDTPENLILAFKLLHQHHHVTLAKSFDEALALIKEREFDVVLADCRMPPAKENSAVSIEHVTIGEIVPNGIFLVFFATKRGARVAIVSDGNHHQDWVSALFDDRTLSEPQKVNGQPVLFINYLGKKWDEALAMLTSL